MKILIENIEKRIEELKSESEKYVALADEDYYAWRDGDRNSHCAYCDTYELLDEQVDFLELLIDDIKGVV